MGFRISALEALAHSRIRGINRKNVLGASRISALGVLAQLILGSVGFKKEMSSARDE